ncbi:IS1 family transposase [Klebsiella pneumoniae]|uniref:IS1 family transposase n=1 Tax=Klebsiella pneumoniae TaxID=573 RepID=UPI003A5996E5
MRGNGNEQWGYVGAKPRQRWLFHAYIGSGDGFAQSVFGERDYGDAGASYEPAVTLDVVIWMTDGWSRIPPEGKLHVISKRYTQRIERHNLTRGSTWQRLGRSLPPFKIGGAVRQSHWHYLNTKHYQ